MRRGECPGLSAPMQTGDGLLVRLRPIGTIPLPAFAGLCAAAHRFGNGIVEVTARGSIQIRGLSAVSAPHFAAAVAVLGIAAEDGVAVHINPLAGLDPDECFDAAALAADLRHAVARTDLATRLSPKVSVAIDGGGAVGLDDLSADVRLRAERRDGGVVMAVSAGGDAEGATLVGFVTPANGAAAAIRLLEAIARHGRDTRARSVLAAEGIGVFCEGHSSISSGQAEDVDGRDKPGHDAIDIRREVIGRHRLRDASFARGLGLAFGHIDAQSLGALIDAAALAGAAGMRTAPGRSLLAVGLSDEAVETFAAEAETLGFIIRPDDPRRFVVACAGAPTCAAAHIAVRAMAPRVAADHARLLGSDFAIHLSGCCKGCAHPAPAALTIVGTPDGCALVADGSARDTPFAIVAPVQLPAAIGAAIGERGHG